jgi:hypothetical protein
MPIVAKSESISQTYFAFPQYSSNAPTIECVYIVFPVA